MHSIKTHKIKKQDIVPLVTIGIPTYNRPDSLAQTLNSLHGQSYKKLEIIISDNCSPGRKTRQVAKSFQVKDKRVVYFRQKENIGAVNNFIFTLEKAHGEFFMWLADDDRIDPEYIRTCVQYLIKNPDHSLVGGQAKYYYGSNFTEHDTILHLTQDNPSDRVKYYYHAVILNGIFYGVYRKEYLSNAMKDCLASDFLYIADIAFKGKVITLPQVHIHRGRNIREQTVADLVDRMNYKGLAKRFPHLSISINIFYDILTARTYASLSLPQRLNLALSCFFIFFNRYAVRHFYHFKIKYNAEKIINKIPYARVLLKKFNNFFYKLHNP